MGIILSVEDDLSRVLLGWRKAAVSKLKGRRRGWRSQEGGRVKQKTAREQTDLLSVLCGHVSVVDLSVDSSVSMSQVGDGLEEGRKRAEERMGGVRDEGRKSKARAWKTRRRIENKIEGPRLTFKKVVHPEPGRPTTKAISPALRTPLKFLRRNFSFFPRPSSATDEDFSFFSGSVELVSLARLASWSLVKGLNMLWKEGEKKVARQDVSSCIDKHEPRRGRRGRRGKRRARGEGKKEGMGRRTHEPISSPYCREEDGKKESQRVKQRGKGRTSLIRRNGKGRGAEGGKEETKEKLKLTTASFPTPRTARLVQATSSLLSVV